MKEGEELCIFYGHKLWFTPAETVEITSAHDSFENPFLTGNPLEEVSEETLPFSRTNVVPNDDDDDEDELQTSKPSSLKAFYHCSTHG